MISYTFLIFELINLLPPLIFDEQKDSLITQAALMTQFSQLKRCYFFVNPIIWGDFWWGTICF